VPEAQLEDSGSGLVPASGHVGGGDGPCVILMVGARSEDEQLFYPVSQLAGRHGASAGEETTDPRHAYANFERGRPGRPSSWGRLPWA
jgi:hypothetical protein